MPTTADDFRRDLEELLERETDDPSPVTIETAVLETHVERAAELFPKKTAPSPSAD
ncbi:MAG: hypothetical protein QOH21_1956 [Acidobacteriota bacterium]|jgi:hypothetical protein|nr:hypothetical protein [Acidobacteriota bacterium]